MSGVAPGRVIFLDEQASQLRVDDEFEFALAEWCRVGSVGSIGRGSVMLITAMGNKFPFAIPADTIMKVKRIIDGGLGIHATESGG